MKTVSADPCPDCGTPVREGDHLCRLCGHLFARVERIVPDTPPRRFDPALSSFAPRPIDDAPPRILGLSEPWFFLAAGAILAPVFLLTPFLGLIGWFFGALVHEMGHCIAGWLVGRPSYPVLSLTGQAMACGKDLVPLIAIGVLAAALISAWTFLRGSARWVAMGAIVVILPLLAFSPAADLFILVGGHLGELAFGGVFLFRAVTGGFTSSPLERGLYSVMGWHLVFDNLRLTGGLMFSAPARAEYAANGSFGLMNDYLRVADQIGASIETVGAMMTVPALLTVPIALGIALLWGSWGGRS